MSKLVKFATYHTEVCSQIVVPEALAAKETWTPAELQSVVQLNHDKLDIYQLSQLDTEVAEMNEDLETEYTDMEIFETIVTDACENAQVVI